MKLSSKMWSSKPSISSHDWIKASMLQTIVHWLEPRSIVGSQASLVQGFERSAQGKLYRAIDTRELTVSPTLRTFSSIKTD